jgi:hypothetical protein
MKLKRFVKSLDGIDEAFHPHYTRQGDGYALVLEDEGVAASANEREKQLQQKIDEMRSTNIGEKRKREELEETLRRYQAAGVDPEEIQRLRELDETISKSQDAELIRKGKYEEVVERRLAAERNKLADAIKKLERERDDQRKRADDREAKWSRERISTEASNALTKVAVVRPGAITDLQRRALDAFKVDPETGLLSTEMVDPDTGKPLDVEGWARLQTKEASYFFEPSQGSGANGGVRKPADQTKRMAAADIIKPSVSQIDDIASGKIEVDTGAPR